MLIRFISIVQITSFLREVLSLLEPEDQMAVYRVATFEREPAKYWKWIEVQDGYQANKKKIDAAKSALPKAMFPGDKLMMAASAYLWIKNVVPASWLVEPFNDPDFPLFISIDKHTNAGKENVYQNS